MMALSYLRLKENESDEKLWRECQNLNARYRSISFSKSFELLSALTFQKTARCLNIQVRMEEK